MRLLQPINVMTSAVLQTLAAPFLLGSRLYVAWQFLASGYLKVTSWNQTIGLFTTEYHTPLLSPTAAAIAGSFGELFFPTLLVLGLCTRIGALGLFAVNAVAVISYRQVLLADGFEAALGQHILWGYMLMVLAVFGAGRVSLDSLFAARANSRANGPDRAGQARSGGELAEGPRNANWSGSPS
jgi:putative oxidoreductase